MTSYFGVAFYEDVYFWKYDNSKYNDDIAPIEVAINLGQSTITALLYAVVLGHMVIQVCLLFSIQRSN